MKTYISDASSVSHMVLQFIGMPGTSSWMQAGHDAFLRSRSRYVNIDMCDVVM